MSTEHVCSMRCLPLALHTRHYGVMQRCITGRVGDLNKHLGYENSSSSLLLIISIPDMIFRSRLNSLVSAHTYCTWGVNQPLSSLSRESYWCPGYTPWPLASESYGLLVDIAYHKEIDHVFITSSA